MAKFNAMPDEELASKNSGEEILPEQSEQEIKPIESGHSEDSDGSSAVEATDGDKSPDNKKAKYLKMIRIVVRTVLWVIVAFLAIIAILLAYDKFVRKSPISSIFGNSFLVIATPSMEPEFSAGDLVIIRKQDSYQVCDVATYFPDGESISVTHRIVRIEGDMYYFRGDANLNEDPTPVRVDQIAGKVVKCFPRGGIIIEWLKTPAGIIFLIAILGVLAALAIIG